MTIDELYDLIESQGVTRDGNTLSAGSHLDLDTLDSLPEGVTLTAGGTLFLGRLTTLPEGVTLTAGGDLFLGRLTTLPAGVTLAAGVYLDLLSLTALPKGVTITSGGTLDLSSLTELAAGVTITSGGTLFLGRLTTLPEGVKLAAGGGLDLSSLTELAAGAKLTAGGSLELGNLTKLPAGVTLSAKEVDGYLNQTWQGRTLRSIDGIVMVLIGTEHRVGAATVQASRYFGRPDDSALVYVATVGEHTAHGATVEDAVEDATLKAGLIDPTEIIAEIKATGSVTRGQYRAITGACREGVRQWCASQGVADETESLPLAAVLSMTAGQYGGDRLVELLG